MIRPATRADGDAIARIYNHYVANTIITFEEDVVDGDEMARRIEATADATLPWVVADDGTTITGYAYASPWKSRAAYRFAVETTVYVDPQHTGRGVGSALYDALFDLLRARGDIHAVIGGIALPNDASIALHERFAMVKVAHFREVGYKHGRWVDVAYWERLL